VASLSGNDQGKPMQSISAAVTRTNIELAMNHVMRGGTCCPHGCPRAMVAHCIDKASAIRKRLLLLNDQEFSNYTAGWFAVNDPIQRGW
jgi:hypothetical protein